MASRFEAFRNRIKAAPSQARAAWHMGRSTGMMWELRPSGIFQLLRMINREYQNPSSVFHQYADLNGRDGELDLCTHEVSTDLSPRGRLT